jgi:hypothetical protein
MATISLQAAVDECASRANADGRYDSFALDPFGGDYYCAGGFVNGIDQDCNAGSLGLYFKAAV